MEKQHQDKTANCNHDLNQQLRRIAEMMNGLEPDLNRIAKEMSNVEILADDLLNHVNSATLGLQHNISRVEHAVAMLGRNRTLALIEERLQSEDNKAG